jgi:N-methylhydantoinase B
MSPSIDPIKRELIKNALVTICDNMIVLVIRTSRSTVVKNNLDFSGCILDAAGEMVVQGLSLPAHLGSTMPAMKGCLDHFGDDIREGDILCNNDPYAGASHLNDLFMFKPLFIEGRRIGFVSLILHHTDMGGRVAGGNATDSTEIWQEGLRIPPLKIYERGKPNETLLRIIEHNVRVSDRVMGDVRSQLAGLMGAEREIRKLAADHGVSTLQTYMAEIIDYSERLTRANIRRLPNGTAEFDDWGDDDGAGGPPFKVHVKVTINDEDIDVDFTGTSPQTSGALNPNYWFTVSMTYAALRTVMDVDLPTNAGFYRAIRVTAPEGSFVNPRFPAPVGARGLAGYRVRTAINGALAKLLPDRMPACIGSSEFAVVFSGYHENRKPFLLLEFHNVSGAGGGPDRDGQDAGPYCLANVANVPVEIIEAENPVRVERYAFRPDSEGAGKYRGALGLVREYRLLAAEAMVQLRSDRQVYAPYGLFGGDDGSPGRTWLDPGTANEQRLHSKFIRTMKRGQVLRGDLPGSGGWGDPRERDARDVAEDVRQEKMSLARARDVYGVVVDPRSFAVDEVATARLRGSGRAAE